MRNTVIMRMTAQYYKCIEKNIVNSEKLTEKCSMQWIVKLVRPHTIVSTTFIF